MIELNSISKQFADKELFKNVNIAIYDGERVGIVGSNGSGKTTLLRIIAGAEYPDTGNVETYGYTIGFLKQITEYTDQDFIKVCMEAQQAKDFFKLKSILKLDGDIDFTPSRLINLSGGEKTKLMLATILSYDPQILLLDEPTNHMDQEGIEWLIKTLDNYNGTVVTVSHDRYFLNKTVDKILEVENGSVTEFYGNYNKYKELKDKKLQEDKQKYANQQALERKLNKQIEQLNNWSIKAENQSRRQGGMMSDSRIKGAQTKAQVSAGKLASSSKAKVSRLEQQKENFIERPHEEGKVYYKLEAKPIGSKVLIRAENLSKSFDNNLLFKNSNFVINAGEKVALKGSNGSGKTTLIKMILGQDLDYLGTIWKTPSLKIAYLSQDVLDLEQNMTVMEYAKNGGSAEFTTLFLQNLANMNMNRQVFDRKISTLSLGERMRIKMCQIVLSDFNMIILDEPTNHLDLPNKIYLEKILKDYKGAMLLVSHDKTLTDNVCNSELIIENKTLKKTLNSNYDREDY